MPNIRSFISELKSFTSTEAVCNPWRDWDSNVDIGSDAPWIRSTNLENYLRLRINEARYIFVAEALGYQGGRFSGIAMTSERILLGNHKDVPRSLVLSSIEIKRTSNPKSNLLRRTQKLKGFAEPTATVVWNEIIYNKIDPFQIILWNIFPFHPYNQQKGPLSNRTPDPDELQKGVTYFKKLIELCASEIEIIAIGQHSNRILNQHRINNYHVPHPANGGVNNFSQAIRKLFSQ